MRRLYSETWLSGLTLFTSMGTLVCCALPALMVTLGAGAALAGLVTAVPELVWLSQYKELVFAVAGAMILVSGLLRWKMRDMSCPIDPAQAAACRKLRKLSGIIYTISVLVYAVGFFFAFVAARLLYPG